MKPGKESMSAGWIYRRGASEQRWQHSTTARMIAMKRSNDTNPPPPVHDYEPALQRAVSWLGDRHLLATPSMRLPSARRAAQHALGKARPTVSRYH